MFKFYIKFTRNMSLSIPLQYLRKWKRLYSVKILHHDQFLNVGIHIL